MKQMEKSLEKLDALSLEFLDCMGTNKAVMPMMGSTSTQVGLIEVVERNEAGRITKVTVIDITSEVAKALDELYAEAEKENCSHRCLNMVGSKNIRDDKDYNMVKLVFKAIMIVAKAHGAPKVLLRNAVSYVLHKGSVGVFQKFNTYDEAVGRQVRSTDMVDLYSANTNGINACFTPFKATFVGVERNREDVSHEDGAKKTRTHAVDALVDLSKDYMYVNRGAQAPNLPFFGTGYTSNPAPTPTRGHFGGTWEDLKVLPGLETAAGTSPASSQEETNQLLDSSQWVDPIDLPFLEKRTTFNARLKKQTTRTGDILMGFCTFGIYSYMQNSKDGANPYTITLTPQDDGSIKCDLKKNDWNMLTMCGFAKEETGYLCRITKCDDKRLLLEFDEMCDRYLYLDDYFTAKGRKTLLTFVQDYNVGDGVRKALRGDSQEEVFADSFERDTWGLSDQGTQQYEIHGDEEATTHTFVNQAEIVDRGYDMASAGSTVYVRRRLAARPVHRLMDLINEQL